MVIFENEDERGNSRGIGAIDPFVYTGRISRHMEGKHYGRIGNRGDIVQDCGGIFDSFEKGIWQRGEGISEGGRIEEIGAREKNDRGICARVQEGSKKKRV